MTEQIPVLKIGPVLIVTIQVELHDRMAEDLQRAILNKINKTGASAVLIDITALEIVDSFIGRVLSESARMARLMGARLVLVGMRPAVTMTLLEMGLGFNEIETAIDIESGLNRLGFELCAIGSSGKDSCDLEGDESREAADGDD